MFFYYIYYPFHSEDKTFFLAYFIVVGIAFWLYKWIQSLVVRTEVQVRVSHVIYFFLSHLFILCLCFFAFSGELFTLGIILFTKIFVLLLMIGLLWLLFYGIGKSFLNFTKIYKLEDTGLKPLAALGAGFGIYMMWVFILAYSWWYTLTAICVWTFVCCIGAFWSLPDIWELRKQTVARYNMENKDMHWRSTLLIDELHFTVLTFILAINCISIFRPFPIGWDDLGVYMNYPKLLSQSTELLALWKMYFWELYTWLGFLVWSQTVAFYLSSFSGVIAAITVYIGISYLLQKKETFFNIPLFCVMILMMMPMSVFQLAKDMKVDFGLLFMSSISLFLMYWLLYGDKHFSHKKSWGMLGLIGFFIWIAFSIKVTSLLLLLWILWMLFYKKFALWWLLSFFAIFVGIFTYLDLWSLMNVIVPTDFWTYWYIFSLCTILVGFIWLIVSYYRRSAWDFSAPNIFIETACIVLWFIIALVPWGLKHISEIPEWKQFGVRTLVSWYPDKYRADYWRIYTSQQLQARKQQADTGIEKNGTTSNEDFWRYFGYEEGINNYLKLPWNLTFQVNQSGEFTDISYIFFVLIPSLFLFLPYRRPEYMYPVLAFVWVLLVYYIPNPIGSYMTYLLSFIGLPMWYIPIFLFVFSPFIYLYYTLKRWSKSVELFLATLAFSSVYTFLWSISAFGVVWYGIVMYVAFLICIALILSIIHEAYKWRERNILNFTILWIVGIYIILSVIPHGVNNLKSASYVDYKLGKQSEEVGIFKLHPEYLPMLFSLNITSELQGEMLNRYKNQVLQIISKNNNSQQYVPVVSWVDSILELGQIIASIMRVSDLWPIHNDIWVLQQSLYEEIIFPWKELKNTGNIYRVGTFLKYYISENPQRVLEDSLLTQFENFIYDTDKDITFERFKKLDIDYMLIDLNAATIDQWVEKNLTKRYEHILEFMTYDKLQLIESDSICLKLWLEHYKNNTDIKRFIQIAGVNYGTREEQIKKRNICLGEFVRALQSEQYPFIDPYQRLLQSQNISLDDTDTVAQALIPYIQPGYKVLFELR